MASSQMLTVQFLKKNRSKQWKNERNAACYNIKSILNVNWSSKQNKKLAIKLRSFQGRFGRSIEIVIKITFQKLYLTNPKMCHLETKT